MDINIIIDSDRRGNYLINEKSGEILVDGRAEYDDGRVVKPANDWGIICYLMNVIDELKKISKLN